MSPVNWKDCGYIGYTKSGDGIVLVVHNQRYFIKLDELKEVIEKQRNYTLVYEPLTTDGSEKGGSRAAERVVA